LVLLPLTLESPLGFRDKIPARVLFPFKTQVSPVWIFRQNQFELLLAAPAFDLLFPHLGADYARVPLVKHAKVYCAVKLLGKSFSLCSRTRTTMSSVKPT